MEPSAYFKGNSLDTKRNLYKSIINNLEPLGIPKDQNYIKGDPEGKLGYSRWTGGLRR